MAVGANHECALLSTGEVRCMGDNRAGQLGTGTATPSVNPLPVRLPSPATDIVAGQSHTCALMLDGRLSCWGDNSLGQVGDGAPGERRLTPSLVASLGKARAVTAGYEATCALVEDGTVYCWGKFLDGDDEDFERLAFPDWGGR
jgi:alpha-tubulin suppressor-like RCC1 family protein